MKSLDNVHLMVLDGYSSEMGFINRSFIRQLENRLQQQKKNIRWP